MELYIIESGRAEPMKKVNENRFFMAQVHHEVDEICSNGGRAEQSTKVIGFGFVDAQVHHEVDEICSNGGRAEI